VGLGLLVAATASAHTGGSTGYASLTVRGNAVRYSLTLTATGLAADLGERLSRVRAGEADAGAWLVALVLEDVTLVADGIRCEPGTSAVAPSQAGAETVTVTVDFACAAAVRRLIVRDATFERLGADHHTLVKVEAAGTVHQGVLEPGAHELQVALDAAEEPRRSGGFLALGIEHILTGVDHMLFLAALLLGGAGLLSVLETVTAFTVAHSVTLAAAVLGGVTLPDRLVEPVIAASIGWVALENLLGGRILSRRWLVSLAFGLVHGFGFAGALAPLALPRSSVAWALLSFNAGVEVGQSVVIALVVPLLAWSRRRGWEPAVVRVGSIVLIAVSAVWFVERLLA
jgi:hypothetical protein